MGSGLTQILPSVADLASLVILPSEDETTLSAEYVPRKLTRAQTMPVNPFSAPFLVTGNKTKLVKSPSMAQMRRPDKDDGDPGINTLCIYLNNNAITKLPQELFWLQRLAVLNLRKLCLRYLLSSC